MRSKRIQIFSGVGLVLVLLLGANLVLDTLLSSARSDWTEERLFTISDGTRELVAGLSEPVRMELYWSASTASDLPSYKAHAQRVLEFLEELVHASDGKLSYELLDPEPFSEAEDAATAAGLAALPISGSGASLTLGLVGRNAVDRSATIPFLDPSKEGLLEYEIARLIHGLDLVEPPKVALISAAPVQGAPDPSGNPMAAGSPPWQILRQLEGVAEVELVEPSAEELPEDTDVLVLIHPKGLSQGLLEAIDRYAFEGGDLVAFVDPHCEAAVDPSDPRRNPMMGGVPEPEASDLGPLLAAWGVEFDTEQVLADRRYAQAVSFRSARGIERQDMVVWPALPSEALDQDSPLVAKLSTINLASSGLFTKAEGAEVELLPLLESSDEAGTLPATQVASFPDPQAFARALLPRSGRQIVAARVVGKIARAFPATGDRAEPEAAVDGGPADEPAEAKAEAGGLLLFADADLLADGNWIQEQRLGSLLLGYRQFADNGALFLNAVETLGGGGALIDLRRGGSARRPFLVVEELRRAAEARYQEREQALQAEITATQTRIAELQRSKSGEERLILSDEQAEELDSLQAKVLEARKELRAVRHGLQKEIDALGKRLMLANVLGMPALVALGASLLLWRRNRRMVA